MAEQKEFLAMKAIERALSTLDNEGDRQRVVMWTVDKFSNRHPKAERCEAKTGDGHHGLSEYLPKPDMTVSAQH